jgi:hypothetical protein
MKDKNTLGIIAILFSILAIILIVNFVSKETPTNEIIEEEINEETQNEIKYTKDGVKYLVNPDKIRSGGPPKDGIPSIDDPKFVSVKEANQWIEDDELVIAIDYKDVKRIYPFQIMVWHEIVNDQIAGDPILITYCPLCGSGIAYERKIAGVEVEFGTSGKLYNSNLVMYDRKTDSYWTQIGGQAIIGPLTGEKLKPVSIDIIEWQNVDPDAEVLSKDTGYIRDYGRDPYGSYYIDNTIMFPVENEDNSIHLKTVIFGIEINGTYKAYKESDLIESPVIEDTVNNVTIKLVREDSGIITITTVSGEEIVKERDFWFAWHAFHPETLLYEP